jgi:hypothetical protein
MVRVIFPTQGRVHKPVQDGNVLLARSPLFCPVGEAAVEEAAEPAVVFP